MRNQHDAFTLTFDDPARVLEMGLAAYVAATANGATNVAERLRSQLVDLRAPEWLLDNVRSSGGRWSVSDDDRIDVIVTYAARVACVAEPIEEADFDRLRAVGLSDLDIFDLNDVIAVYNAYDPVVSGPGVVD